MEYLIGCKNMVSRKMCSFYWLTLLYFQPRMIMIWNQYVLLSVRFQPVSPPPTKRVKHERSALDASGRSGQARSGRVKPEAALGSAQRRGGRTSTPQSVIVISDTEDDVDIARTLLVYNQLLKASEVAFILLYCGTVSQQNYDNLTSPSDNSIMRLRCICSVGGCNVLWLCFMTSCINVLTYICMFFSL